MDRLYRTALAGPSRDVRELEQRVQALPLLNSDQCIRGPFPALSGGPDFAYAPVDDTITCILQHGMCLQGGTCMPRSGTCDKVEDELARR